MLHVVKDAAESVLFQFNANKSMCIAFGPKLPTQPGAYILGAWRS